jgi:putative oxidoreductase
MNRELLAAGASLLGRILLVAIFLPEAWIKIRGYEGVVAYMEEHDVPGALLPLVIAVEIAAPVLIIIGWQTRWAALVLAGFAVLAAWFFHTDFTEPNQVHHFWKNLGMAGGFLVLAANGPGAWSLEAMLRRRGRELGARTA